MSVQDLLAHKELRAHFTPFMSGFTMGFQQGDRRKLTNADIANGVLNRFPVFIRMVLSIVQLQRFYTQRGIFADATHNRISVRMIAVFSPIISLSWVAWPLVVFLQLKIHHKSLAARIANESSIFAVNSSHMIRHIFGKPEHGGTTGFGTL